METKGTPSTCTTSGNGYYHCTTCNVDYADEQGDWLYVYGHASPILGHDIDDETGKCSRCDAEYQMLKEGMNTNLTFEAVANNVSLLSPVFSDFTTVYCFKAPATGQLTIKCGEDDYYDLIGLFDAQFDLIGSGCSVAGDYTSITKPVVEGNVYYIGMRAYSTDTQLTGRTLIISGTWPRNVTITDGEAFANESDKTVNSITYKRTVSEDEVGKWEALYVPFQMGYDDWSNDFDVATLVNVHEYSDTNGAVVNTVLEARYVTSGYKLKANTPYLIRLKTAGEKTITLTNATIEKANSASIVCQSVEHKYTFAGTYQPKQGLQSAGCYFITDGKLKKATDDETTLKAQRWYMTIENLRGQVINGSDASDANAINICIITDDDHTKTLTKTEAVAATCTKAGNTAYYHCSECGTYFSNAAGTMAIAENSWVIPATGQHSYVNGTCTQCGGHPSVGDINADGNINITDVTLLIQLLNQGGTITNKAADVNGDGNVTVADVEALKKMVLGIDPNLIEGKFSVSKNKKVQFTKGNLYYSSTDDQYHLEPEQNVTYATLGQTTYTTEHVTHFLWYDKGAFEKGDYKPWSNTLCHLTYYSVNDTLFCGEKNKMTVDGTDGLYVLSGNGQEWDYLLEGRTNASNLNKCGVTVTTNAGTVEKCLVLAPDGYSGTIADSYNATEWAAAEAQGLVCLPAGGYRYDNDLKSVTGHEAAYWLSSPSSTDDMSAWYVTWGTTPTSDTTYRATPLCIRLVKTVE